MLDTSERQAAFAESISVRGTRLLSQRCPGRHHGA